MFIARALTGAGGTDVERLFATHVYDAAKLLTVVVLFAGAARPGLDRTAWGLMGLGLALSMIGDILWSRLYEHGGEVPIPSLCDVFYVGAYIPMAAASLLFIRGRRRGMRSGLWLDGLISALAVATVFAAFILEPISRSLQGERSSSRRSSARTTPRPTANR